MSEVLPDFKLLRPTSIKEALNAFEKSPTPRYCAGGTDFLVNMRRGLIEAGTLIDLGNVKDLTRIEVDSFGSYLGAGLSLREIAEEPAIAENYPAVVQAAKSIAGPTHREIATLGGNLCLDTRCQYYNQSHWWRKSNDFCLKYKGDICHVAPAGKRCRAAFSGDLAPALMVYGAEIDIAGQSGNRRVALKDFYNEDGADHLKLEADEIVLGIHLPPTQATSAYEKIRIRGAVDFPLAGIAITYEEVKPSTHRFNVAITGTNSCPVLVEIPDFEANDIQPDEYFDSVAKCVQKAVSPQRTTTTAAHYRRLSVAAMAKRLAKNLWEV